MNDFLTTAGPLLQSLRSPAILFFVSGIIIGLIFKRLQTPKVLSKALSAYLMVAIGFKGGIALAGNTMAPTTLWILLTISIFISFGMPFLAYALLRATTRLDRQTAGALAAHYGSVSVITFITAESFLKTQNIPYAGYMVAILAAMEAPAIVSGMYLTRDHTKEDIDFDLASIVRNTWCVALLALSFVAGLYIHDTTSTSAAIVQKPFQVLLYAFLFDMGLLVAQQVASLRLFTPSLIAFGLYMPCIGSIIGLCTSYLIGLDAGSGALFMALCASASYIAVPAAMRLIAPQAKASVYVPMTLGITFPFNVTLGIPIYLALARHMLR
jgi:hypothetical protein